MEVEALTLVSGQCEQFVSYECQRAPLNTGNTSLAWWVDRWAGQSWS